MSEQKTAILILGMHRSGTSALTRVLNLCGVDLGTRLMPPAQDNNDSGFWEHVDAVDAHERLLFQFGRSWSDARALPDGWLESEAAAAAAQRIAALVADEFAGSRLWAVKDPRLCRFLPLWLKVLGGAGVRVKLLYALRHPDEVIASLVRRDGLASGDPGAQAVEDSACLVFIETQLAEMTDRLDHDHLVDVIRKTARKMSPAGLAAAADIPLAEPERALLASALS